MVQPDDFRTRLQDFLHRWKLNPAGSVGWLPLWLSTPTLLGFVLLFLSCAYSLVVLNLVTASWNGLSLTVSTNHYAWTYGPTAILIVILALWRQVDYYCKLTQPWREMMIGPTPAHRSVLLDYISPFQISAFVTALRLGHYPVVASITTFTILKLIVLTSTALLVVGPAQHQVTVSIRTQKEFQSPSSSQTASSQPIWSYLQDLNADSDNDMFNASHIVFPTFELDQSTFSITNLKQIVTEVEVLVPEISCEPATVSMTSGAWGDLRFKVSSPTCLDEIGQEYNLTICEPDKPCSSIAQAYTLVRTNCSGQLSSASDDAFNTTAASHFDMRYIVAAFNFTTIHNETIPSTFEYDYLLQDTTSLICKIGYSMGTATLTHSLDTSQNYTSDVRLYAGLSSHIPDLTNLKFSEIVLSHLGAANEELIVNADPSHNITTYENYASLPLFQLMLAQQGKSKVGYEQFLEQDTLNSSVYAVLAGITAKTALQAILVDADSTNTATAIVLKSRLYIRSFAIWAIGIGFSIAALLTIFVVRSIRNLRFHQELGTIAALGALITTSDSARTLLSNYGKSQGSHIEAALSEVMFEVTAVEETYVMEPTLRATCDKIEHVNYPGCAVNSSWTPLAVWRPVIILTLSLPLLAIGALEVLSRTSRQRQGLVDMSSDKSDILSYIVPYGSTLIVFTIATLFNNLDFTIVNLLPFSRLSAGCVLADQSVLLNLLGTLPVWSLIKTIRAGSVGAVASNIACSTGSILSIVVSGLWISRYHTFVVASTNVYSESMWNNSWPDRGLTDGGAATTLNTIHHGGGSQSLEIWNDLVLPRISAPFHGESFNLSTANHTFEVTALQPELQCEALPQSAISVSLLNSTNPGDYVAINITAPIPASCTPDGESDPNSYFSMNTTIQKYIWWFGQYMDLTDILTGTPETACPSISIVIGSLELPVTQTNPPSVDSNLVVLLCTQRIRMLNISVTYKGAPDERILDSEHPPRPTDGDPVYLRNMTSGSTGLSYQLERFFDEGLSPADESLRRNGIRDRFATHLLQAPYNLAVGSFTDLVYVDALVDAVSHLYRDYMAIVIDLNFRVTSHDDEAAPISGSVTRKVVRLGIHEPSKLVLQILLACMTVLGAISIFLVNLRGILPRDPNSIASTMALLADSQLCQPNGGIFPERAEMMTEAELRRELDGYVFSMGWWHSMEDDGTAEADVHDEDIQKDGLDQEGDIKAMRGRWHYTGSDEQQYKIVHENLVMEKQTFGIDVGRASALGFTGSRLSRLRTRIGLQPKLKPEYESKALSRSKLEADAMSFVSELTDV